MVSLTRFCIVCMVILLFVLNSNAQVISISGTVSDSKEVLVGASVQEKNTGKGTVTDVFGKFNLQVSIGSTIRISYIGYVAKELIINSDAVLNIILEEDSDLLSEVVVIGYGSVKKSDITGSVSSVKEADIKNTAILSIDQGLQGKVPGMVVSMGSGQPGAASSVRIRGTSSINGNSEPLYVIDGVFIVPESSVGAVTGPSLNPLATINPSDIESVEVLKDASATAIYGTRGANGVVLVTTKRGKRGAAEITMNYTQSYQKLRKKIPMLNAAELAVLGNEAADNESVPRKSIYASPVNLGVGTDWQDQIFEIAPMSNFQVAARGGSENTTYAISANYFVQNGIIKNSDFVKGNIRINLDQKLTKKISLGTSININRNALQGVVTDAEGAIPSSVTSWALAFNPGLGVYTSSDEYVFENNTSQPAVGNPVADINSTEQIVTSNRLLGNIFLTWDVANDFKFKSSIGTDAVFSTEKSFLPNNIKRGQASNGQAVIGKQEGVNWLLENTLSYSKRHGVHDINAVVGHSLQAYDNSFLFTATSDFADNRLGYNAIQVGSDKTLIFNGTSGWQLQSFLGRVNYNLLDKYLVTVSARVDGSSKFGAGNKYGTFPSFAFAWRAKDEKFLKNSQIISDMKLRMGYGMVGNEGIPPYSSQGLLETTEAYFGENEIAKGSGPASRQNDALKWETTSQFDVGLDIEIFDSRLTLVTDIYYKKTKDLLLNAPVPYTSGFAYSFFNVGSLENKGLEIAISSVNIDKGAFKWTSSFNIAFNKNKVLVLNSDEGIPGDPLLGINGWTSIRQGQPIGTFYGYKTSGIIQLGENLATIPRFSDYVPTYGDRKYVDKTNDGVLNENDMFVLGNANPDFSFGLNNTLTYRKFALSFFIQGVYGNEIVNFNKFSLESFDGNQNNSTAALERWTPENPTNKYPRATVAPRVNTISDHQVEDGSYLRVKDITFSYELANLMSKLNVNVKSFNFFVSGKNLITLTNYTGYDPEVNRFIKNPRSFGADYGTYPTTKIFSTGLTITF
ncbi:MAG: TonB-dependent receptor [Bacteroidetes bacterium CHB5]|nr:TonB-dependent receptor [Bacteroidetes bacterium CHB5]